MNKTTWKEAARALNDAVWTGTAPMTPQETLAALDRYELAMAAGKVAAR